METPLQTISLVLAAGPGFPNGSPDHRYALTVQLDGSGRLTGDMWFADPRVWTATRHWPDDQERQGDIIFDPDHGWSLRFFPRPGEAGDAPLMALTHIADVLRPGEYLTVREPDGRDYSYRIVQVG